MKGVSGMQARTSLSLACDCPWRARTYDRFQEAKLLITAGGLLFTGSIDRRVTAHDQATGKVRGASN